MWRSRSGLLIAPLAILLSAMSAVVYPREVDDVDKRMRALPADQLMVLVRKTTERKTVRWRATAELARRKHAPSGQLLIQSLRDDYHAVRGAAAWGLCRIGGQDAQDALLEYLRWSLEGERLGDLVRATEAQKELPDERAVDLLIKSLRAGKPEARYHFRAYASEALGKIGDPKGTLPVARLLDSNVGYSMSWDYLYLEAIARMKGRDVAPMLVEYLSDLAKKMLAQPAPEPTVLSGREARQARYNSQVYGLTLTALVATTGAESISGQPSEVAEHWRQWLERDTANQRLQSDADTVPTNQSESAVRE